LNDAQRAAVEHIDGPTLVLAGAGSGKTRALTHKIAYLVSRGVKPWRILAVTFTNKAAREMATRVQTHLNIPVEGLWIGTFHGICVRIIRREAERWGFKRDFTIYDRDDQLSTIKKAMKEFGIDKERLNPAHALHTIGRAKNEFTSPEDLENKLNGPDAKLKADIYRRYNELLKKAGAFDFDDLLMKPVEKFGRHPDILGEWQRRFDHILVDEYQDTNHTQYLLMKMLCGDYGHVTVVGDDDQSIYSWRGADITNILRFESDFKDAKTVRLEQNYRSTGTILRAANSVVAHNTNRMSKKLWTEIADGDPVEILECGSERDEAERIVSSLKNEMKEYGFSRKDFAILYRTNAQSRAFEDVLRRRGIPYVIVGGLRFYERKEIKDILAYLRLLANPDDEVAFVRAITTPKRKIGDRTIERVSQFVRENGITFIDALNRAGEYASGITATRLKEFSGILKAAAEKGAMSGIDAACEEIVEAIDYKAYLEKEHPENADERFDNVRELITAMNEYENPGEDDGLSAFLAEVSLMSDVDSWEGEVDRVTLMTLHSAKGLEFPSVFIVGVEKGLFPLSRAFDEEGQLEEERRLFYVGITRAEQRLHVSYAASRERYGTYSGGASMFIKEIPGDTCRLIVPEVHPRVSVTERRKPIRRTMEFEDYSQDIPDSDDLSPFSIGSYVSHPKFGRGEVTASSSSGGDVFLTIRFVGGMKKIKSSFVRNAQE